MEKMPDQALLEHTQSSEMVFEGKLVKVCRETVRLPDGNEAVREFLKHPGAVVIVAELPDQRLVFERQYRHPLGRVFIEFPAGKIDAGEDITHCAQRELREETGYQAGSIQHVGVMHPGIGYSNERIEIFLARDLTQVGSALDEGEFIQTFTLSPEEAKQAIYDGTITDAKTITALFITLPLLQA